MNSVLPSIKNFALIYLSPVIISCLILFVSIIYFENIYLSIYFFYSILVTGSSLLELNWLRKFNGANDNFGIVKSVIVYASFLIIMIAVLEYIILNLFLDYHTLPIVAFIIAKIPFYIFYKKSRIFKALDQWAYFWLFVIFLPIGIFFFQPLLNERSDRR